MRVSKLLAQRGLCSRREADAFISAGWVLVDGKPVRELGVKALPTQDIRLNVQAKAAQRGRVTILLNKPVGYVAAQPEEGYRPAMDLVKRETLERQPGDPAFSPDHLRGLAPAGRLDIDSKGLMVFTQDGRVARLLVGPEHAIEKEYLVRIEGRLATSDLARLKAGVSERGEFMKAVRVEWVNADQLRFVLREGKKRQIRRMCEAVGVKAVGLKRVRIGKVMLGKLPEGRWRYLRQGESF